MNQIIKRWKDYTIGMYDITWHNGYVVSEEDGCKHYVRVGFRRWDSNEGRQSDLMIEIDKNTAYKSRSMNLTNLKMREEDLEEVVESTATEAMLSLGGNYKCNG